MPYNGPAPDGPKPLASPAPPPYRSSQSLDAETEELIQAALHLDEIARWNSGQSQFVAENGRHGRSPWSEFVAAVEAYRGSRAQEAVRER